MAAKDFSGIKGFATVVPVTQNNNLYALRLAQQKQIHDEDMLQKRQAQDQSWFDEQAKLGFPSVRSELQTGMREVLQDSYRGMSNIYRTGMTGNRSLDPREKQTISDIKTNYDTFSGLIQSFDKDLTKVETLIRDDKEKVFNQPAFANKLKTIIDGTFTRDDQGRITAIDPRQAQKLSELTNDPEIYDDTALAKQYISKLGQVGVDQIQNNGTHFTTNKQEFTNGLYETNENGTIAISKQTGMAIPKATGESIMLWDSDPIRKQKLDNWARSMTKEGQPWELQRGRAFEKMVVDKFGTFKENKTVQVNSGDGGSGAKRQNAEVRYNQVLRPAIFDGDKSALAQAFSANDRIKLEYEYPNGPMASNKPLGIKVLKREVVYPSDMEKMSNMNAQPRYSEWKEFERLPLGTEDDKNATLFKLNSIVDESQGRAGLAIGGDVIRDIHDKYQYKNPKKQPKQGAADNL